MRTYNIQSIMNLGVNLPDPTHEMTFIQDPDVLNQWRQVFTEILFSNLEMVISPSNS